MSWEISQRNGTWLNFHWFEPTVWNLTFTNLKQKYVGNGWTNDTVSYFIYRRDDPVEFTIFWKVIVLLRVIFNHQWKCYEKTCMPREIQNHKHTEQIEFSTVLNRTKAFCYYRTISWCYYDNFVLYGKEKRCWA